MHKAYKTSALPVGPEKTSVLPVAVRPWKKSSVPTIFIDSIN